MRKLPPGSAPPARPLRWGMLLALVAIMATGTVVLAQSGSNYRLYWHAVTGGGALASGTNYQAHYSFGQSSTVDRSTGSTYMVGQGYWLGSMIPTAVRLTSFTATPAGRGLLVAWETATEHNNAGFHLYRRAGLDGLPVRLNQALIPSRSPGGGQGAAYTFDDASVQGGVTYFYILEDVDWNGTHTPHGPVPAVAPYARFLPLVQR